MDTFIDSEYEYDISSLIEMKLANKQKMSKFSILKQPIGISKYSVMNDIPTTDQNTSVESSSENSNINITSTSEISVIRKRTCVVSKTGDNLEQLKKKTDTENMNLLIANKTSGTESSKSTKGPVNIGGTMRKSKQRLRPENSLNITPTHQTKDSVNNKSRKQQNNAMKKKNEEINKKGNLIPREKHKEFVLDNHESRLDYAVACNKKKAVQMFISSPLSVTTAINKQKYKKMKQEVIKLKKNLICAARFKSKYYKHRQQFLQGKNLRSRKIKSKKKLINIHGNFSSNESKYKAIKRKNINQNSSVKNLTNNIKHKQDVIEVNNEDLKPLSIYDIKPVRSSSRNKVLNLPVAEIQEINETTPDHSHICTFKNTKSSINYQFSKNLHNKKDIEKIDETARNYIMRHQVEKHNNNEDNDVTRKQRRVARNEKYTEISCSKELAIKITPLCYKDKANKRNTIRKPIRSLNVTKDFNIQKDETVITNSDGINTYMVPNLDIKTYKIEAEDNYEIKLGVYDKYKRNDNNKIGLGYTTYCRVNDDKSKKSNSLKECIRSSENKIFQQSSTKESKINDKSIKISSMNLTKKYKRNNNDNKINHNSFEECEIKDDYKEIKYCSTKEYDALSDGVKMKLCTSQEHKEEGGTVFENSSTKNNTQNINKQVIKKLAPKNTHLNFKDVTNSKMKRRYNLRNVIKKPSKIQRIRNLRNSIKNLITKPSKYASNFNKLSHQTAKLTKSNKATMIKCDTSSEKLMSNKTNEEIEYNEPISASKQLTNKRNRLIKSNSAVNSRCVSNEQKLIDNKKIIPSKYKTRSRSTSNSRCLVANENIDSEANGVIKTQSAPNLEKFISSKKSKSLKSNKFTTNGRDEPTRSNHNIYLRRLVKKKSSCQAVNNKIVKPAINKRRVTSD